jgi:hypothetical protein
MVDAAITGDEQKEAEIEEINRWIQGQIKPRDVAREEVTVEKNYEELCLMLGKHTNQPVKKMTVFEFYTLLQLIKNKKIQ